jgi:hypothetical protein
MGDDFFREVPADIAAQIDRRGVMLEAAEHVAELHHATTRLGDALVTAGLPGRAWRSDDALLSLLDESLPDVTVDALITRLAEFGADLGPVWLHGNARDLEDFHQEVAVLRDAVRPLRTNAQHLRMGTAGRFAELPIERAFASALVATPLDLLAAILRDLELLAPVMTPLAPEEWDATPPEGPPRTLSAFSREGAPPFSGAEGRARDRVPVATDRQHASQTSPGAEALLATLLRRLRASSAWLQAHKLVATAGLILALAAAVALVQVASRPAAPSLSALAITPTQLALTCSGRAATLSLQNEGKLPLAWQAEPPAAVGVAPARGTLQPGQRVLLRVTARSRKPGYGAIIIATADHTATVPYTMTCR